MIIKITLLLALMLLPLANAETLKQAAPTGFKVGTTVAYTPLTTDSQYQTVTREEFHQVTFENAMKPKVIFANSITPDFSQADAMKAIIDANGQSIYGHTLCWAVDAAIPQWILNQEGTITRAGAIALLESMIDIVMTHYPDVLIWDVVNEPIEPDLSGSATNLLRDNFWLRVIGPDYLRIAFAKARAVNPAATLVLNDYNTEHAGPKADRLYNWLNDEITNHAIPVDAIGFQFHEDGAQPITVIEIEDNMARFKAMGLRLIVSELDVKSVTGWESMQGWARRTQQGNYTHGLMNAATKAGADTITFWGLTDPQSWQPAEEALPFSNTWVKKPMYWAVHKILKGL